MWMAFGIGLLGCLILNLSTGLFDYLHLDARVHDKAVLFVRFISFGMPAFALYRVLYSYTSSLNCTRPIMIIALFSLVINAILNGVLIYGYWGISPMGVSGCALATGICMWLMLGAMLVWIKMGDTYKSTYPFFNFEKPHWPRIFL